MRKRLFVMINILVLLTGILNPGIAYAKTSFREASIDDLEGTVKVIIAGGQKEYKAYKGMGLTQGDTVITAEKSSVTLYIDEDKEVKLGENTRLTLSELSNYLDSQSKSTGLKLWVGKIWVDIKKKLNIRSKFEITTGSTIMGVKGTKFYVGYELIEPVDELEEEVIQVQSIQQGRRRNYRTNVAVLDGTVTVMPFNRRRPGNHRIDVHANQMLDFTDDQAEEQGDISAQPFEPQDLDLFILEQIAKNPENYDEKLRANLEQLLKQKREEAERRRKERTEEQQRKLEIKRKKEAEHRQQYIDPTPTPTLPTFPAPITIQPEPTPTQPEPSPSITPSPSGYPMEGPEVLESIMPMQLYPGIEGQTRPTEAVIKFTKELSPAGRQSVEEALADAVISGNPEVLGTAEDLNYSWTYDDTLNADILTVTIKAGEPEGPTPMSVLFKNVRDIFAFITDSAGNGNTVKLYEVDVTDAENYAPKYAQIEKYGEINKYYTSTIEYTIPLPPGMYFSDLEEVNWNDFIFLGGVLAGNSILSVEKDYDFLVFHLICDYDENNNIDVIGEGQGTIIISNWLMQDTDGLPPAKPICATIDFSQEAFSMSYKYDSGDGENPKRLILQWDDSKGVVSRIYMSDNLPQYHELPTDDPSLSDIGIDCWDSDEDELFDMAYITDLKLTKTYWIRGYIEEGDYKGYTKVIRYDPGVLLDVEMNWAEYGSKLLPEALDNMVEPFVSNPEIADVELLENKRTISIKGKKHGSTTVTVSGTLDGESMTYTFKITVKEPEFTEWGVLSPSAITLANIGGSRGSYVESFIVELPEGYTFMEGLSGVTAGDYIMFEGVLKHVTVSRISNDPSNSNKAVIELVTDTDDESGQKYIYVPELGAANLIISGTLLEDYSPETVIKATVMVQ